MTADLQARLDAAERVCLMFGWSPSRMDTPRDKAAHELWSDWFDLYGADATTRLGVALTDEYVEELARKRDETRRRTLAALGFVERS